MSMNNCVHADDSAGAVFFIHRNDPAIWGGNNAELRYDLSTDKGLTWAPDKGVINPSLGNSRYPQVAGYRPLGNTAPLAGKAVFLSDDYTPVVSSGFLTGTASLVLSGGSPTSQESALATLQQYPEGGMAEGANGEYWAARFGYNGSSVTDSLRIFKGTYNPGTQSTTWALHSRVFMPWSLSFDGMAHTLPASVAFSPDGSTGWIATLGDLSNGSDTVFAPILIRSTNGGVTWDSPVEVDLSAFGWVDDSLRALWMDTTGNPASTGRATTGYDFDLTVDAAGNPHLFFVIGSASTSSALPSYSIYAGLSKYAVDLSSSNQGSSFDLRLVSPILTFRGSYGAPIPITQDNYPQVSRSQDGQYIFYSWLDSDTAQFTGNMSGIGFGVSDNLAPNLRIAGLRLADGFSTCIHLITDGDLIWEGRALSMQLAPEVFVNGSGPAASYNLPIVGIEMLNNDPSSSCLYHYFGNDAMLTEGDFAYPPGSTVFWLGCGINPSLIAQVQGKVFADYNSNGVFDGGDIAIPNEVVSTGPTTYADVSDANGDYDITCLIGQTYQLNHTPLTSGVWIPTVPLSPYSVTVTTAGSVQSGFDFGYAPVASFEDLAVTLITPNMRPGFVTHASLYVENHGTLPTAGTLVLTYDPLTSVQNTNPPYTSINTTTHEVTWTLPTIPLFGSYPISLDMALPWNTPISTPLNFSAQVSPTGVDAVPVDNSDTSACITIGSYDPNDKAVFPAGTGSNNQVAPGTDLKYRVRFQNTGTASAITVVVRDTLDTDLAIGSFHMVGASHAYTLAIEQGHILVWTFDNINLPDSNTNEPASHGYIDFSISPKAGLPLGTVVENSASIYFDFNAPVLTNTAWITYDVTIGAGTPLGSPAIRVFPNPVRGRATVEFQRYDGSAWTFELSDLQGRRVLRADALRSSLYAFDREGLPSGIYLYRVQTAHGSVKSGKVVLE